MFAIFRLEVNTEVISVLLTIIGYSINNSIVVFDRVRENMKSEKNNMKPEDYRRVIDTSLDSTLSMSVYSSLTTLLPVIFLLIFGSDSIFTFTFAMFIGMIAGTFSSLFLAPDVWYYIRTHHKPKNRKPKKEQKEKLDEYTIKGINA